MILRLRTLPSTEFLFGYRCMTFLSVFKHKKVAEKFCETVGEILKSNGATDDDGGSFFRVRVMVNNTSPLCRGRVITLPNGNKNWIKFRYERLPSLCYWCGRLDHDDRD